MARWNSRGTRGRTRLIAGGTASPSRKLPNCFAGGTDYLEIYDEEHSQDEDRFIAVGSVRRGVILVVFTEWDADVVRIISARVATADERRRFLEFDREKHGRRDS
jgi:uncharacterized DUF497 family protein